MQKITQILSQKISHNRQKIEDFFTEKFNKHSANFYNSVDLRHCGAKIAPIDTNCFPAGFNNLSKSSIKKAQIIAEDFLVQNFPDAKNILIIPENHTRNLRYLENLLNLQKILSPSRQVVIGSVSPDLEEKTYIDLEGEKSIILHPVIKESDNITTKEGFVADLIILNNDLTSGLPEILQNIATPIVPSPNLGWHKRTKSQHFDIYNNLAEELSQIIDIDPWLISSMHSSCHDVNFKEKKGLECLAKYVDGMIGNLEKKYQEYGIQDKPYCYVKSDNGTYGMAVWSVSSGAQVLEINKKDRNKMNMLKGSVKNTQVMIQEGIRTTDKIDNKTAEPMIYLINGKPAANLFRVNESRDEKSSLNAANASFFDLDELSENQLELGSEKNQINEVYSLIARLAALSSAIENI